MKKSNKFFRTKLFLLKAENSILIASHIKNYPKIPPEKEYWNYWAITISYYAMLYAAKAAIQNKGYEVKTHKEAQEALKLLLTTDLEKEDLELLEQSHKIFEDEYLKYFENAKEESYNARYSPKKTYTERQLEEIFENAREFVGKISLILE